MSEQEVEQIKRIFEKLNLHPEYMEHEEVITSQEAARTRGFELKQGIKAIVFTNGTDFAVVDVPADMKVDQKKVCEQLSWQKKLIRMANPEEVEQQTGCIIGSVPPFGHKNALPILVDPRVYDNEESDFNIGLRTHSAKIPTSELHVLFKHVRAIEGSFAK